jgi:hypothetical protein
MPQLFIRSKHKPKHSTLSISEVRTLVDLPPCPLYAVMLWFLCTPIRLGLHTQTRESWLLEGHWLSALCIWSYGTVMSIIRWKLPGRVSLTHSHANCKCSICRVTSQMRFLCAKLGVNHTLRDRVGCWNIKRRIEKSNVVSTSSCCGFCALVMHCYLVFIKLRHTIIFI